MRVRFAPSPTGYLHVGGARTALFNYLLARKMGGTFVLRIEDTDQERSRPEHVTAILDGMRWLGFEPDEGPYFQADGFQRHRDQATALMFSGFAYPIFADDFPEDSPRTARPEIRERARILNMAMAATLPDAAVVEQNLLLKRMAGPDAEPFAIAFRVPDYGRTEWHDLVHGEMGFDNEHVEDFILIRGNGVPTYNMACASDDVEHRITHVLRGDDHIANTPKQIMLHHALAYVGARPDPEIPAFGHLPMILGEDGQKMSKRHGATSVSQFAEEGILPEALVNFLALLGWNPGDDREIMSLNEMIEAFSLERAQKKAAVFDRTKLAWMNETYLHREPIGALVGEVLSRWSEARQDPPWYPTLAALIEQYQPRAKTIPHLIELLRPYRPETEITYDPDAAARAWADPIWSAAVLAAVSAAFDLAPSWSPQGIEAILREFAARIGVGLGKVAQPLRVALLGIGTGCGIDQTVYLMGQDLVQKRITAAVRHLS